MVLQQTTCDLAQQNINNVWHGKKMFSSSNSLCYFMEKSTRELYPKVSLSIKIYCLNQDYLYSYVFVSHIYVKSLFSYTHNGSAICGFNFYFNGINCSGNNGVFSSLYLSKYQICLLNYQAYLQQHSIRKTNFK